MEDMKELYAWTETAPDGKEGVIAVISRAGFNLLLQHRDKGLAMRFKGMAQRHARENPTHRVRLIRFVQTEIVEEVK